jgi:SAM-dependent methyltransferase
MTRRSKSFEEYAPYFVGSGIDIGCGDDNIIQHTQLFPQMVACRGYDLKDGDANTCRNIIDESMDFLHSSHCLEHLPNPVKGIRNWTRVVKTGGYLVITVPDEQMYEKGIWPSAFNSQHFWSFRFGGFSERASSIDANTFFDSFRDIEVVSIKRITDHYYDTNEDLTKRTDIPIECCIEIVLKKVSHSFKTLDRWILNGFCFMLNSLAMGDVIAAVPIVKYMIERYYQDEPDMYKVVAKEMFRPLFSFVPDANFRNFEDKENNWGIPKGWTLGALNQKPEKGTGITRNTPKSMHLSQFAAFKLVDRALNTSIFNYVPLPEVDISHFYHDFSRSIIMVSSYRDTTRMWKAEYMLELAAWIVQQGYEPVFVGKTDMNLDTHLIPKTSLPEDLSGIGLDLRNKTSMLELATIIGKSRAIVGLDSGPIHLAGTTTTPIVCGYTTVAPEYRIPYRPEGASFAVVPTVCCKHCESHWAAHLHNYEECYFGPEPQCCAEMTADKFVRKLQVILAVKD